jgi:sugar phosphate permease
MRHTGTGKFCKNYSSVWVRTFLPKSINYSILLNYVFLFLTTRNEKRKWFMTLLVGTSMLYSTRTTMPLLVPTVAAEKNWSKTDSGTVLSSFFWGYTLTQVILRHERVQFRPFAN